MFWSDLGPRVGYEAIGIIDASLPTVGVFAKASSTDTPATAGSNNLSNNDKTEENKSKSGEAVAVTAKTQQATDDTVKEDFGKGVVFYLRDEKVVGIVLWNVFNRINIARSIINEGKHYDDLNEVAKLFEIHS